MGVSLPSDERIRARAEELSLLAPGAALDPQTRARVASILLEEDRQPAVSETRLLSRVEAPADGGTIRVDVTFIPTPKKKD